MSPTQLQDLELQANYPKGIAARVDSPLLKRLLEERAAAVRQLEKIWQLACTQGDIDGETDWVIVRYAVELSKEPAP